MDFSRFPVQHWGLQAAGLGALGLVWFALNMDGPPVFGMERSWVLHGVLVVFAAGYLLGDQLPPLGGLHSGTLIQAASAIVVLYLTRSSVAPILMIVVIAQSPFHMGVRPTIVLMVLANIASLLIMQFTWGLEFSTALLTTLLYGTFQVFALLVGGFALSTEAARQELAEVNAELLATRSLLVESARDRERLRLSRELHDVAGHTLTALKLNLRSLARSQDSEARQLAEQSLELSENLLADVRALVGNFRSNDGLAVDRAIQQLTAPFDTPRFELAIDDDVRVQDLESAQTLLGVAREAITNVVRHANASLCRITLSGGESGLRLVVEDDGVGIRQQSPGQGIRGMAERLESVGGRLDVQPVQPTGTRVTASIGSD